MIWSVSRPGSWLAGIAFFLTSITGNVAAGEEVILEISGKIKGGGVAQFTRKDLEAIGHSEIKTGTPWHDGVVHFEGVLLSDLIDHVDGQGRDLLVSALNNYSATIPSSDLKRHMPLLAMKLDGKYMKIEDKGPLFVIYPFDADPKLGSELFYSRSVWQVSAIEVK
ncbi:oxidoreductase [Roseibium denhamense]|uniref:Oxidoreductase molybdopterin-binding domain-containing protein n=1 Tax=Roseibium denhamense TaxID=76305 RepID=A0ABY1PFE1_9HYPH|nr:oxidoreductase [Roseibium denhamense]MTI05011.1 oxidoreductase [Roseibium denhamense]SMP33176.1 hypothetical protein SAMN06265374_3684 [Roseibium denhamense]